VAAQKPEFTLYTRICPLWFNYCY